MTAHFYWQIDTAAEPQRAEPTLRPSLPGIVRDRRSPTQNRFDYYAQVAQATVQTGFDGAFLPYRRNADESRIVAAVIARAIPRIYIIPEFPASVGSAVYASKQAATFQRSTQGRLGWAIAPDHDTATRAAEGDYVAADSLGERIDEFLTVARGVQEHQPFSFTGRHFEVEKGGFEAPLSNTPFPTVFLQGEGENALILSARHADVHLFNTASPERLTPLIERLNDLAAHAGRHVAFGLIQPVLVRETEEEARHDAAHQSQVQGTLVGSFDDIAARLAHYSDLGITHFILSSSPTLEEAYRVGQHLLPRLHSLTSAQRAVA